MTFPLWAWWILAGLNVATLFVAMFDKVRARRGGRRVRERTLLGLAMVGGSAGLLVAMIIARHKVRKRSFLGRLLFVLVIQLVLVGAALYFF